MAATSTRKKAKTEAEAPTDADDLTTATIPEPKAIEPGDTIIASTSVRSPSSGLAIGRTVHFVNNDGTHRAAIVTYIHLPPSPMADESEDESGSQFDPDSPVVDLVVFPAATDNWGMRTIGSIPYDPEMMPGSWHWPEFTP